MKTHELAQKLLSLPNAELQISVDISKSEKDAFKRVFSDEYLGVISANSEMVILQFSGYENGEG